MRIVETKNKELCEQVRAALEANDGYCPCALDKTDETKCMCKTFRDKVEAGYIGECECGLYKSEPTIIYLCGDINYRKDFLYWFKHFSLEGMIVIMPPFIDNKKLTERQTETLKNLHIQKMLVADCVFVIDKYGTIDEDLSKTLERIKRIKTIVYASEIDD